MFEKSILEVQQFTRPILSVMRTYENVLAANAATLFFVNEVGVAVTCKHVAEILIIASNQIWNKFENFKTELRNNPETIQILEQKYGYSSDVTVQILTTFQNCFDTLSGYDVITHPTLDIAIIKFKGFNRTLYSSFAKFISADFVFNTGKFLCRLGYPFPEFTNFRVNPANNNLEWTQEGNQLTPPFPIEGMFTRLVAENGAITGIELSTPGLRGQSGGPLFDNNGFIYGMQSQTMHLHLGFDMKDKEVQTDFGKATISNYPFLHVGRCVHASQIVQFLIANQVKTYQVSNVVA